MTSYYVTLISGASAHQYENTSSKFINKLPIPLQLDEDMEFGICELSYVRNMNNIEYMTDGLVVYDFLHKQDITSTSGEIIDSRYGKYYNFDIMKGYYKNQIMLCKSLNDLVWSKVKRLKYRALFNYNASVRRFQIETAGTHLTIFLKHELAELMGISTKGVKKSEKIPIGQSKSGSSYIYKGKTRQTIDSFTWRGRKGGLRKYQDSLKITDNILIYCDLVSQQLSGDSFSNLLRMSQISGEDNQRVTETFEKIHYVPASKRHVSTIEIQLKTVNDIFIGLKDITYVKLHFRKRRPE